MAARNSLNKRVLIVKRDNFPMTQTLSGLSGQMEMV